MNQGKLALVSTNAEMEKAGFARMSDGSWLPPIRPALTQAEAERIYRVFMKPMGQSQIEGLRRNVFAISQDTGVRDQT